MALNEDPLHLYESIPNIPCWANGVSTSSKESKLQAPIQPPTHDSENRQINHNVEGSSDYYVNDVQGSVEDSNYYVNDP